MESVYANTRAIGISVCKETWNEFYTWEQDECRRALDSLAISEPLLRPRDLWPLNSIDDTDSQLDFDFEASAGNSYYSESDTTETFTKKEFDTEENSIRYSTLTSFTYQAQQMKAYPRYEICTPASTNYVRNPLYEQDQALFVPYVDDEEFPIEGYLDLFHEFSWQVDFTDPDRKSQGFFFDGLPNCSIVLLFEISPAEQWN